MDAENTQRRPFSVKLWPPSQTTRVVFVERMTKNLSSPTVFTKEYGTLSKEEAVESAKEIENAAFAIACDQYEKAPDGDGSSAVQLYARECSNLVLEVLQKGSGANE